MIESVSMRIKSVSETSSVEISVAIRVRIKRGVSLTASPRDISCNTGED